MGLRDLQDFLDKECASACKDVDLLRLARTYNSKRRGNSKNNGRLRLVVDAESCLDRLYGGFYSDWACGGQWNRMVHFLGSLIQACQKANMELVVFFNGALESERLSEWAEQMVGNKKKVASVLKHIHHKATPPPKVWWMPPICLRQCLRMALRQMGVAVACSMDDHHQEVIAFCREDHFHGIIAHHADYAIFDPPRYFSANNLKLTYRQALETKEYLMDELARHLDLNPKRFCLLAALLGNHILTESDLREFSFSLGNKNQAERIRDVASFVRSVKAEDGLDEISKAVFKYDTVDIDGKVKRLKKSVQYYLNGTQDGFLNYTAKGLAPAPVKQAGSYPTQAPNTSDRAPSEEVKEEGEEKKLVEGEETVISKEQPKVSNEQLKVSKEQTKVSDKVKHSGEQAKASEEQTILSDGQTKVIVNGENGKDRKGEEDEEAEEEKEEQDTELKEFSADSVYTETDSGYAPAIVIEPPPSGVPEDDGDGNHTGGGGDTPAGGADGERLEEEKTVKEGAKEDSGDLEDTGKSGEVKTSSVSSTSSSSTPSDPDHTANSSASQLPASSTEATKKAAPPTEKDKAIPASPPSDLKIPQVAPEIMRIASERHQKGLMSPWIYQVLSQGEIKVDVTMEDETNRELPTAAELYRPVRQAVYAILFDVYIRRGNNKGAPNGTNKEVIIKEWTVPKGSSNARTELVRARPFEWRVPNLRRLWLGQAVEDKNRRLRAFLTCLRSDTPRMLSTSHVQQHLLIMACVLRYMMLSQDVRVLRKPELDAFLCCSVSPLLHDVETMQEMKLPMITSRGVHLAALFMRGVEAAILANDACGAPIPWSMCVPWHFFDGKLFHFKLLKANNNTPLLDMCDGQVDQMMRVERMRDAILDGIPPESLFAKPVIPLMHPPQYGGGGAPYFHPPGGMPGRSPGMPSQGLGSGPFLGGGPMGSGERGGGGGGRGRGLLGRSPVDSRGGQLQIAGVVVGNWGPNMQANQVHQGGGGGGRGVSGVAPPHVTAVGPRRGGARGGGPGMGRGLMKGNIGNMPGRPSNLGRGYAQKGQFGGPRANMTAMKSGLRGAVPAGRGALNSLRSAKGHGRGFVQQHNKGPCERKGLGRGLTIENPIDNSVVPLSQLMKPQPPGHNLPPPTVNNDRDFGQFIDSSASLTEPVKHAEVKVNMDRNDDDDDEEEEEDAVKKTVESPAGGSRTLVTAAAAADL